MKNKSIVQDEFKERCFSLSHHKTNILIQQVSPTHDALPCCMQPLLHRHWGNVGQVSDQVIHLVQETLFLFFFLLIQLKDALRREEWHNIEYKV